MPSWPRIAEAQALHASGADSAAIQNLLQHARELLDIIAADEAVINDIALPEWAGNGLEQMRERLTAAETRFGDEALSGGTRRARIVKSLLPGTLVRRLNGWTRPIPPVRAAEKSCPSITFVSAADDASGLRD